MLPAHIAVLLRPFLPEPLSHEQLEHISTYIDLLQRWNARINLTAIHNEEEIVTRHFGESLFLARHLFPKPQSNLRKTVLDIGSGAGFPALPLAIWNPTIILTLIESNHKKVAFLREVSRALTLTNINIIPSRTETVLAHPNHPQVEVVTLRAVERFESILPQTQQFLADNGMLALLIGSSQLTTLLQTTTLHWLEPLSVPLSASRVLATGIKRIKSGKEPSILSNPQEDMAI